MNITLWVYIIAITLCTSSALMLYNKWYRNKDLSVLSGIITRVLFSAFGIVALIDFKVSELELLYATIAVSLVFFSDIVGSSVDIISKKYINLTEYKRLEKILNDLMFKYKLTLDTSPIAFYVIDVKGNIEYVNNSFAEIIGMPRTELLNKNILSFVSDKYKQTVKEVMHRKFSGEYVEPYSIDMVTKGEIITVKVYSNLTVNGHPTITGSILTMNQCGG